jgi:hypothetical protein
VLTLTDRFGASAAHASGMIAAASWHMLLAVVENFVDFVRKVKGAAGHPS